MTSQGVFFFPVLVNLHNKKYKQYKTVRRIYMFARSFQFSKFKIHLIITRWCQVWFVKYIKKILMVIHRESSHLSRLKWKLVSAQHVMFSCFRQHCQFMEMKLVLNFTVWVSKTHTVSDRCVMTFFKRRVGISQDSLREDSGALDTECLCFPLL